MDRMKWLLDSLKEQLLVLRAGEAYDVLAQEHYCQGLIHGAWIMGAMSTQEEASLVRLLSSAASHARAKKPWPFQERMG